MAVFGLTSNAARRIVLASPMEVVLMSSQQALNDLARRVPLGYPSSLAPEVVSLQAETVVLAADIDERHHAANGFLHAGASVTLADTACGFGTLAGLPEGAIGFTTVELKSNHLATIEQGRIIVTASRAHAGRSTQVWDAEVAAEETGRTLALFRCTQLILYPR